MKNYFNVLRQCPLFQMIEDDHLLHLVKCLDAKITNFSKKETIIYEGSHVKQIGILLSGSAQIIQMDYYGNRTILSTVEPSELFAEAFACADIPTIPVSVVANEPCEVMLIDCKRLLTTCTVSCGFHHQLIYNLMKNLAMKTILFSQKLEITSKRSTQDKLMTYLMIQAKKAQSDIFDIPFDRQELADFLEVDRSGLSAVISKLKKEGILKCHRNHFELL